MYVVRDRVQVSTVLEVLEAIQNCVRILVEAAEEQKVLFDDQAGRTAFQILRRKMEIASKMDERQLADFLRHLRESGTQICQDIIQDALYRTPPVVSTSELTERLDKTPPAPNF